MGAVGDGAMIVICAMLLDAALGEPRWLWARIMHPAVAIGHVIGWADTTFNSNGARRAKGAVLVMVLILGFGLLGHLLSYLGPVVEVIGAAILLAHRSLVDHVANVAAGLRLGLISGRQSVAMIVGRDTRNMDQSAVCRGAIESAAENLSDGVVAPLFWFVLGGLPGILIYKAINTADSMVGYKNDQYRDFGWAAARLDDILNFAPARLSALCIQLGTLRWHSWAALYDDARLHRSPNAGWPEAAMAQALGIALSGPRSYDGEMQDFAYANPNGRKILGPSDIDRAVGVLWRAWGPVMGLHVC